MNLVGDKERNLVGVRERIWEGGDGERILSELLPSDTSRVRTALSGPANAKRGDTVTATGSFMLVIYYTDTQLAFVWSGSRVTEAGVD